jgi:hypothetical protein
LGLLFCFGPLNLAWFTGWSWHAEYAGDCWPMMARFDFGFTVTRGHAVVVGCCTLMARFDLTVGLEPVVSLIWLGY